MSETEKKIFKARDFILQRCIVYPQDIMFGLYYTFAQDTLKSLILTLQTREAFIKKYRNKNGVN